MTLGVAKHNCLISAPQYGSYKLTVTGLGYGKKVIFSEDSGRRSKSFYPMLATSGEWFVTPVFRSYAEKNNFSWWLTVYYNQLVDPNTAPLLPMTVSVASRNFRKVGYPVSAVDFGDEFGKVLYPIRLAFMSASEPEISSSKASRFLPALRESAVSQRFYPSGVQSGTANTGYAMPTIVRK